MMKIYSAILALILTAAVLGCGGSDTATSAENGSAETISTSSQDEPKHPIPEVPPQKEPLKKLVVKELKAGEGPPARWGDDVSVRYVGVHYETGKPYSQHWGFSWTFKLDGEQIGPGWQKGIHGMRPGERREILIPARLIFDGSDGDLAYVVELVEVKTNSYARQGPFAAIRIRKGKKKPVIDPPGRSPPTTLLTRDLKVGSGPAAQKGDEAFVYFAGAIYETGKIRFYGWRPFPPAGVVLGSGLWGKAWEEGIEGMKVGGRREVIVPSPLLKGNPAVDYLIELVKLDPGSGER
jgi:peptidylprolyl isomerase